MDELPSDLGRRLVIEMRERLEALDGSASDALRFGADELEDEDLWIALLAALAEAQEDGEYWRIGDGVVDESIRTRPLLTRRLWARRETDPNVSTLFRVMQDERWNWTNANSWAEPKGWLP